MSKDLAKKIIDLESKFSLLIKKYNNILLLNEELKNCFGYFKSEFEILKNLKIIVALGKIAFDTCVKFYRENFDYTERVKFGHGTYFKLPNNVLLMGCYHPSPRNVNTGRINEKQMTKLFKKVKELV